MECLDELAKIVPGDLQIFIDALRAFDAVRISCLGQDHLPSYAEDIAKFKEAYLKLGINITTKAHMVFEHIAEFFKRKNNGKGLGYYSEQARYVILLIKFSDVSSSSNMPKIQKKLCYCTGSKPKLVLVST